MNLTSLPGDWIAADTETTGLSTWHGDRPFAFSFCNEQGETRYLRMEVNPKTRQVRTNQRVLGQLQKMFGDRRRKFVFWNSKFDVRMLESIGVPVLGEIHDAMFGMHALNAAEPTFKLKPLARKYADYPDTDERDLHRNVLAARRQAKRLGWKLADSPYADYWLADKAVCEKYATGDAERTMLLWHLVREEMPKANVQRVYDEEMELWPVVYEMETRGVRLDYEINERWIQYYRQQAKEKLKLVHRIAGEKFDPNKPDEMRRILYNRLKLPVNHLTTRKQDPATNVDALKEIDHPIGRAVLEFRACEKALSTFFLRYKNSAVQDRKGDWIIHPDFHQMGPRTGRFSCRNPNLQNTPDADASRSAVPIQAREPFGPRSTYYWYSVDYSQIEVRLFADQAQERVMLSALSRGEDLHGAVANECWPEEYQENLRTGKKNARGRAKMLLFGKLYGIGKDSSSRLMNVSRQEADEYLHTLESRFPRLVAFTKELVDKAKIDGEIRTLYGRRIPVEYDKAYRAVNYLIQGTAADIIKRAMRRTSRFLKKTGVDAHIVLTIHDELILEWKQAQAYKYLVKGVQREMENHGGVVGVPLPTEVSRIRRCWNEKQKIVWERR